MYKYNIIKSDKNILIQLNERGKTYKIDSKNLYAQKIFINSINFYSYNTKVAEFFDWSNTLYITQKKYSKTTSKQLNILKNNFIKYNNSKIEYAENF